MREGRSVVIVCGRDFVDQDLERIRAIIADESKPNRAEIARRTCRELHWLDECGRLKAMSCRVALLRLQDRGLLTLPPPRGGNGNGKAYRASQQLSASCGEIVDRVDRLRGLQVRPVTRADSGVWNEAIARFHYLGYSPLPGAQQRYLVEHDGGVLGAIGFGASAWKVAARDSWIGWSSEQRKRRLQGIVNNARFLLLPWVRVENLASRVLSMAARRIAMDWRERYGYAPVLLETFVERERFRGTCYQAANWICLGETKGRGKLDRYNERALPIKRIYVYPLVRKWREELCI